MGWDVRVQAGPDGYRATVEGMPSVVATGRTKAEVLDAVTATLHALPAEEIVYVPAKGEVSRGWTPLHTYTDEQKEMMREICEQIYRDRDAEAASGSDE